MPGLFIGATAVGAAWWLVLALLGVAGVDAQATIRRVANLLGAACIAGVAAVTILGVTLA